jgi:hypothetical protein
MATPTADFDIEVAPRVTSVSAVVVIVVERAVVRRPRGVHPAVDERISSAIAIGVEEGAAEPMVSGSHFAGAARIVRSEPGGRGYIGEMLRLNGAA